MTCRRTTRSSSARSGSFRSPRQPPRTPPRPGQQEGRDDPMTAPADTAPALAVTGLSKRFGASVALQDVDLAIGPGEVHAVLGENGSGKSTLIKILSGFHRPQPGTVTVAGQPLPFGHPASSYRLGARFVHQDLGLVDSIPVLDNLAIGAGFANTLGTISTRRSSERARTDLARVGLAV